MYCNYYLTVVLAYIVYRFTLNVFVFSDRELKTMYTRDRDFLWGFVGALASQALLGFGGMVYTYYYVSSTLKQRIHKRRILTGC